MKAKISVTDGPAKGQEFEFDTHDTFIFGRGTDAHCRIPDDKSISRNHFILEVIPPNAQLRDLGSTNGFTVNGKKYAGKANPSETATDLRHGDVIHVGKSTLSFSLDDPDAVQPKAELDTKLAGDNQENETGAGSMLRNALSKMTSNTPEEELIDLPRYEIKRMLGKGAMGAVYLGRDKKTGRVVAIKTMLPKVAMEENAKEQFLREAKSMKKLVHPNIVELDRVGFSKEILYIALEYIDHGDLQKLMRSQGGKLPVGEACELMLQILDGMAAAHNAGYIHRDIKPQNILIDKQGDNLIPKVADLGMAKNYEKAGLSGFTATGSGGGRPAYMPREQLTDFKYAKPSADVFSLAATFYEMLCGTYPYDFSKSREPIAVIIVGLTVPIAKRMPSLPGSLCRFLDRCLLPDPDERYQDAAQMRKALKKAMQ